MSTHLTDVSFLRAAHSVDLPAVADFGAVLAHQVLNWHQQTDETAILEAVTSDVTTLLDGADAAAVVSVSDSRMLMVKAAAGPAEMLQAALPGTLEPSQWVVSGQARPTSPTDGWPVSGLDHQAGMGSMLCAPLGSGRTMFGTLLVLGFAPDAFTPQSAVDIATLAVHASIALAAHRQRHRLEQAGRSRDIIGQAKGILMHQQRLTAEQAFEVLREVSQSSNVKLREVAADVCLTGTLAIKA